jgi:hypothetical protein
LADDGQIRHFGIRITIINSESDVSHPMRDARGRRRALTRKSGGRLMAMATALIASSPGQTVAAKLKVASLRALRTLIQGIAGAFPSAGAGTVVLSTGYWQTFGYACLAALITAAVSFLQNVATILPADPAQGDQQGT